MSDCAFCGKPTEGNHSIHRDGFGVGPEVDLCDACGSYETPTCEEIWERIALPSSERGAEGIQGMTTPPGLTRERIAELREEFERYGALGIHTSSIKHSDALALLAMASRCVRAEAAEARTARDKVHIEALRRGLEEATDAFAAKKKELESDRDAARARVEELERFLAKHGRALLVDVDPTGKRDAAPTLNARTALSVLLASAPTPAVEKGPEMIPRCGKQCDHGSPCKLAVGHANPDRHETHHGCIFYDAAPTPAEGDSTPIRAMRDGGGEIAEWGIWCERTGEPGFWRQESMGNPVPLRTTEHEAKRRARNLNEGQLERTDSLGWRYEARPHEDNDEQRNGEEEAAEASPHVASPPAPVAGSGAGSPGAVGVLQPGSPVEEKSRGLTPAEADAFEPFDRGDASLTEGTHEQRDASEGAARQWWENCRIGESWDRQPQYQRERIVVAHRLAHSEGSRAGQAKAALLQKRIDVLRAAVRSLGMGSLTRESDARRYLSNDDDMARELGGEQ